MIKLPKLKISGLGWDTSGEIVDFDQARYLPFGGDDLIIMVEDRIVRSYDDLVQLANLEQYRDRENLEIKFLSVIVGG